MQGWSLKKRGFIQIPDQPTPGKALIGQVQFHL